ncbi:MAG: valine--tRNA ligase [Pyrinomonadaceae bacterium]
MELDKAYNPKAAEENHYQYWEDNGFFAPEVNEDVNAPTYSIVIPPPNVTGSLHMGHALQHTLMDALTRWKRMCGYRTLFLVGVDHAGISTQLMVTRQLKNEEHKTPHDIGREAFTERVWQWKHKYGGEITRQIRGEGLSVDWSRERFTMEDDLSKAVREVFVRLYKEGSIYRGARIVNWCPKDKTVLSDLEVKDEKAKGGKLYFLKYPIKDEATTVTVATTRPETMLGDTAVAVNPDDDRYRHLIGKTVELPLSGRQIPVIADEYVESEFGTGAVKITPAHDPNDWEIGERHGLDQLVIMDDSAAMNALAGEEFVGLDRYAARELVIEKFEQLGLLDRIEDHDATLPHCERCGTVIEPLLSEQWFVKMDQMRNLALSLMKDEGMPRFSPKVPYRKVYTTWLENLRDWTISRQLWWGHQIPAWYDPADNVYVARTRDEAAAEAGTDDLRQDEDVLDTWFSSALWPFSTLGWTGDVETTADLEAFYPTDVLVTGRDIISLWVSRMVMTGLKFIGERPFDDVIIHGTVLDRNGQRMSKTKANGIDPLTVFERFGVDATRMALAGSATGVDFAWRDEKVESFRNFANKIWNATRFCLMNANDITINNAALSSPSTLADRWIVSRLNKTAVSVNYALETYQFHEAVQLLYHFFWDDFCDWYIELVKDEIAGAAADEKSIQTRTLIITVLEQALRMLHPFMPFLTEELWQKLPGVSSEMHDVAYSTARPTIMLTSFPKGDEALFDQPAEREMNTVIDIIKKVRNIRAEINVSSAILFTVHIAGDERTRKIVNDNEAQILKLARGGTLVVADRLDVPKASAKAVTANASIAVPLEGLIDFEKERLRLRGQIEKLREEKGRLSGQLSNQNFVDRAPAEKVQGLRDRFSELEQQIDTLTINLEALN